MSENRETCFVIMPFSKTSKHTKAYWSRHFETFLKPLIEENPTLEAHRSKALRGDILTQIITDLVNSRVVVADVTDHNCNVYWELGVRQSFKHGTVTIAEVGTELPFDIGGKGTLFYNPKDHIQMEEFRTSFKQAVQDCLQNPGNPDSHVLETLGGRGTLFEVFRRDEAMRRLDALLSEIGRNSKVLGFVRNQAKKNKENPTQRAFTTARLRIAAVELLITNRYVEEDAEFFNAAEAYQGRMIALKEQLNLWENSPEMTETWFLKYDEKSVKSLEAFEAKVITARDKLSKRL